MSGELGQVYMVTDTSSLEAIAEQVNMFFALQAERFDQLEGRRGDPGSYPVTQTEWDSGMGTIADSIGTVNAGITSATSQFLKSCKSASFTLTSSGTVVDAIAGRRIKVYAVKLAVSAAISVAWRDGSNTALEGEQSLAANAGYTESVSPPAFLFGTSNGNSLDLIITGAGTAAGRVSYWDSDAS